MKTQKMAEMMAVIAIVAVAAPAFGAGSTDKGGDQSGRQAAERQSMVRDAEATIAAFRRADPGLSRFFDSAMGYAVFPSVGKGAIGVGGAHGTGVLFQRSGVLLKSSKPVGETSLTQVTVGAQLGGQAYSEVVFFETEHALSRFKKGEFAMAAEVSAVIAASGASADVKYANGVAVFTMTKGGLMAEASVGGQKFGFTPFVKSTM